MIRILLCIMFFFGIYACSAPTKPVTGPAKRFEINPIDFDPHAPVKQEVEVNVGEEEVFSLAEDAFDPVHLITWWNKIDLKYKPVIEDFMKYHLGAVENWGKSRSTGYIPRLYNELWRGEIDSYTYPHLIQPYMKQRIKGFHRRMLDHCPILADGKYNAPVTIGWRPEMHKAGYGGGSYSDATLKISADGTKYYGGPPRGFSSALDFDPNADSAQQTFIHEWGHHIQVAMDLNLGRTSHSTKIFSESFAQSVNRICDHSPLDDFESVEILYRLTFEDFYDSRLNGYRSSPDDVSTISQYSLGSLMDCIVHERYHGTYNANEFMKMILEAYLRVEGRKLQNPPYPVNTSDGLEGASWTSGATKSIPKERYLPDSQPMLATRSEFLQRFLEVYDCGRANELLAAEAEGLREIEW